MIFAGCSSMRTVQYPEVIYNYRQPLVSVTYEYGEIDIEIPIVFPGLIPGEMTFEVYAKGDSINPLLTVKNQATNLMKVFLPQGVLGVDTKDNFIKITPHHPDFVSLSVPFFGIAYGSLVLDPVHIVQEPLDVAGVVTNRLTDSTLAGVDISLYLKEELLQKVPHWNWVTNTAEFIGKTLMSSPTVRTVLPKISKASESSGIPYCGTKTLLFNISELVYAATGFVSHGPALISGQ